MVGLKRVQADTMAAAAARWAGSCEFSGGVVGGYMGPRLVGVAVPRTGGSGLIRAQLCAHVCERTDFCVAHFGVLPCTQHLVSRSNNVPRAPGWPEDEDATRGKPGAVSHVQGEGTQVACRDACDFF